MGSPEEPPTKKLKASGDGYPVQHAFAPQPAYPNTPSGYASHGFAPHGLPTPLHPPPILGESHRETELEGRSRQSTSDEVVEVLPQTRMLQDPTGRLRAYTASSLPLCSVLTKFNSLPWRLCHSSLSSVYPYDRRSCGWAVSVY